MKILCCFLFISTLWAQSPLITNVYQRKFVSLNGKWNCIVDPYECGYYDYRREPFDRRQEPPKEAFFMNAIPKNKIELIEYSFDKSETLLVPGDWNSQSEKLLYYEGTIWYRRLFDVCKQSHKRYFLYFGAINYETIVYLNGKRLGSHVGGFTPFNYEIPDSLLREKGNFLVLKVDNTRKAESVPTLQTDWWNYGGITRDVLLLEMNETFIQDFYLQLSKGSLSQAEGWVQLNGSRKKQKIKICIPELNILHLANSDSNGLATYKIELKRPVLWTPHNPKLYEVIITAETDQISDLIGFRTIETQGTEILLNKKPIFLRGICIHEEIPHRKGRAYSREDAQLLLGWAKELNCNFVRLAHYPHNEHMVRLADELGLLVWEEIPVYWTIQWENSETLKNAKTQLNDVITRDKNRASVIIWSVANETPVTPHRLIFLKELISYVRLKDGARLVSAAMEVELSKRKRKCFSCS
ncbi:MAG: beta-glucuronidase [Cytophagales bacterium]|nr:beta-glucuronidase [Cytophagales bacterium]MDW8384991.1 glycoside hydrolase family 2 TIM barrel-domain containing protein [Flammeovirgaceae bacterium]